MHQFLRLVGLVVLAVVVVPLTAAAAEWQPNTFYSVGALVTYQGPTYSCRQAHTSQVGWEPPNVPALWQMHAGTPTPTPTTTVTATTTPTWTPTATTCGCVTPTPPATATTPPSASPTPPPAPSGLVAVNGSFSCNPPTQVAVPIHLQWNSVPGALNYNVKRGTASGGPYTTYAATSITSQDIWLADPIDGYFVVSAFAGGLEGPNSSEVYARFWPGACPTPTPTMPPRPSPVAGVNVSRVLLSAGDTITVQAESSGVGMPSYSVVVRDESTGAEQNQTNPILLPAHPAAITPNGSTSQPYSPVAWTLTAARSGTVSFVVTASGEIWDPACSCFRWGFASVQSATTYAHQATPAPTSCVPPPVLGRPNPPQPTGVSATAGSRRVTLNWNTTADTHVYIHRASSSGGPSTRVGIVRQGTTRFVDFGVVAGTRYYYVIQAVYHAKTGIPPCEFVYGLFSPYSAEVSAAPGP
jgi:hypothetical protein